MQEQNEIISEPLKLPVIKKIWKTFSRQPVKIKVSLLTLLVALLTIPSLTAFVVNTSNKENLEGHAQVSAIMQKVSPYYSVVSPLQNVSPNEPSTVYLSCNTNDIALSGGLFTVNTATLNNWYTVRSVQATVPQTSGNNRWMLTVLYTGTTNAKYTGKVLCLRQSSTSVTPTNCPPPPSCLKNGVVICTMPVGGWCQSTTPKITCIPRPACLDATPKCMITEPSQGWCPVTKPTCTPRPVCTQGTACPAIILPVGGYFCPVTPVSNTNTTQ